MDILCLIDFKRMNDVFKQVQCGIAHCMCCEKKIYLFESFEMEFQQHFSVKTHIEFLIQFFLVNQSGECQNFNKEDIVRNLKKQMNANGTISEKIKELFKLERDRIVYCRLCNSTVILKDSFRKEYYNHFKQISHLKYLGRSLEESNIFERKYINQLKLQEQKNSYDQNNKIIKKDFQFRKQMKDIEKKSHYNSIQHENLNFSDKQSQQSFNKNPLQLQMNKQNQNFCLDQLEKQQSKKLKVEINNLPNKIPFIELTEKYFLQFIQELTQKGNELEAICFILATTEKVAKQMCVLKFEEIEQELLILSKNEQLNEKLFQICVECNKKLRDEYGLVNSGYLVKQPCSPTYLESQLEKAKQILYQQTQTQDKLYLQFLGEVSIEALTNQLINLRLNSINCEIDLSQLSISDDFKIEELPNLNKLSLENPILQSRIEEENVLNRKD